MLELPPHTRDRRGHPVFEYHQRGHGGEIIFVGEDLVDLLHLGGAAVSNVCWMSWAALLYRVFGVDGLACPHCGLAMTLRTVVLSPPQTERVIRGIEASVRRARGPP